MTDALCFRCGNTKWGALCDCLHCGMGSTGDVNLDIAFSDHHLSHEQLQYFGSVIEAIRNVNDDDGVCFWTFIRYVSENHADILTAIVSDDLKDKVDQVHAKVSWPPQPK